MTQEELGLLFDEFWPWLLLLAVLRLIIWWVDRYERRSRAEMQYLMQRELERSSEKGKKQ